MFLILWGMQQTMTETERKVIEILTKHEVTSDAYRTPIHAVDRAMGWATADTLKFVREMMDRNLVQMVPLVRDGPVWNPKSYWKEGDI
jgi:hypothetical protein